MGLEITDSDVHKRRKWDLAGCEFCATAFQHFLKVEKKLFFKWKTAIQEGLPELPPDSRKQAKRLFDSPQHQHVDSWLHWVWSNLAEPLADTAVKPAAVEEVAVEDGDHLAETGDHPAIVGSAESQQCRHLPPGTKNQLYEVYRQQDKDASSCRTFYRVFQEWEGRLRFRRVGQHAKCTTCTKYLKAWQDATSKLEKASISAEHVHHLRRVFADRRVYATVQRFAFEGARVA